jgi:hypothetical protein
MIIEKIIILLLLIENFSSVKVLQFHGCTSSYDYSSVIIMKLGIWYKSPQYFYYNDMKIDYYGTNNFVNITGVSSGSWTYSILPLNSCYYSRQYELIEDTDLKKKSAYRENNYLLNDTSKCIGDPTFYPATVEVYYLKCGKYLDSYGVSWDDYLTCDPNKPTDFVWHYSCTSKDSSCTGCSGTPRTTTQLRQCLATPGSYTERVCLGASSNMAIKSTINLFVIALFIIFL